MIFLFREEPYYHEELLNTLGGVKLTSFAKYKLFNKDLYADLVAPSLKTSLLGNNFDLRKLQSINLSIPYFV